MSTKICRWIALYCCLIGNAQAGVLLEKLTFPGFVMQSDAISKSCKIQEDGTLSLDISLDGMNSKRSQPMRLTKNSIKSKINEAAAGKILSESFPVDVPTVIYKAYQKQANGSYTAITLYEANGGSGEKKTNDAQSAKTLMNFIDVNCGDPLAYR
ncbi:MAG: hypothetical protein K9L60_14125 [Methylovulum sp.]|jgi:hypothetical protein|nr:hypothetical protein [Methylovulum sp.]MCF8000069.1 hypothetical protein [Methylovulum sp.]